jgi:PAS domain S-box-containing protein
MDSSAKIRDAYSETDQMNRLLACIEFSKAFVSVHDMESLLISIMERIYGLIPATNWSLLLIDPPTSELYFAVVVGVPPELLKGVRLKLGEGIGGAVAQDGQPIFAPDVRQDHRFSPRVDSITGFETRSIIALPLIMRGEVIGVFEVVNVEDEILFRKIFVPLLTILADYVAIAVDNVRNFQIEVNERNRIQAELTESEGRFRAIIREAAIGIAIIDKNGWVHETNPALRSMLGYSPQELQKVAFHQLLFPKDALKSNEIFNELMCGHQVNVRTEKRFVRKDGKICWGRQSISLVRDIAGEPQFFIAMVEDVTERRLAEEKIRLYQEQLQSLASELSFSEERERRTMAEMLHDQIGQLLILAKMKLDELQDPAMHLDPVAPIKEVYQLIEESIDHTRSLLFELSPPILYDVGFEAAVEWLAEQMRDKQNLHVEVKANGQTHQLDKEMRGFLFRAVRELLFNVIKHAQASRVLVEIRRDKTNLQISVTDNGRGFQEKDPISTKTNQGFGLLSIRERITYFGGRLDIESHPGQGARVTLTMPLKRRKDKGGEQKGSVASLLSKV